MLRGKVEEEEEKEKEGLEACKRASARKRGHPKGLRD